MHPPSIRPRSAQRQRTWVDIGASLAGPCHFGKGFYLGNSLVFPSARKVRFCAVESQTDRRQACLESRPPCASGTNPCWARATTRPSVRSTGRSSWTWSVRAGRVSRTELARRSRLTKPTVSTIIDEFIDNGTVREVGQGRVTLGRGPSGAHARIQRCLRRLPGHPFRGARHAGGGGRCPRRHPGRARSAVAPRCSGAGEQGGAVGR